jgi:hydrogenase maturation protease
MEKILVYGYGNPGRQDDGIGARFIELMESWIEQNGYSHINTDCNYQLNIEDSALIADYDKVYFVDASVVTEIESYKLEQVEPNDATIEFTMHAVSVAYVVDLCRKVYGKLPQAFVLHVKAYEFDFKEELTEKASENMNMALEFLKNHLISQ